MPQDSLQKLYKAGSEHYDLGDYDTFAKKMQNAESRQKFYNAMSEHYDLGDYNTFEGKLNLSPTIGEAVAGRIAPTTTRHLPQEKPH